MTTNIPINVEDLNKLSKLILNNIPQGTELRESITNLQNLQNNIQNIQNNTPNVVPNNNVVLSPDSDIITEGSNGFYKIAGLSVPPKTLYLLFVLIAIGFMIWKSGQKSKSKKDD